MATVICVQVLVRWLLPDLSPLSVHCPSLNQITHKSLFAKSMAPVCSRRHNLYERADLWCFKVAGSGQHSRGMSHPKDGAPGHSGKVGLPIPCIRSCWCDVSVRFFSKKMTFVKFVIFQRSEADNYVFDLTGCKNNFEIIGKTNVNALRAGQGFSEISHSVAWE